MTISNSADESAAPSGGGAETGAPEAYHHRGENLPTHGHHDNKTVTEETARHYWAANLRLLAVLLAIWFTVSFGFSILFVDQLNTIQIFGFKLGFWWAQQGSIYIFVGLILIYTVLMKRIERRFGVDDDD